jgi:hypothetical protein
MRASSGFTWASKEESGFGWEAAEMAAPSRAATRKQREWFIKPGFLGKLIL